MTKPTRKAPTRRNQLWLTEQQWATLGFTVTMGSPSVEYRDITKPDPDTPVYELSQVRKPIVEDPPDYHPKDHESPGSGWECPPCKRVLAALGRDGARSH